MTTCELSSPILVLVGPNVVSAVDSVVTGTFGGILFNFFYRNCGSEYITEPYRKNTTVGSLIG